MATVLARPRRLPMAPAALILGDSAVMADVRADVERVAPTRAAVLLTGASGSGKECVARAIHAASDRADAPFVAINCGAIPRDLLESELFGHEKGSFTGATATRLGRFEEASGGTIFLDEIGDMPADMQVKLLRVLEEGAVSRVGGARDIAVDVRVIAATHRDIAARIADGGFREDLYYRLAVFPIALPPLAARTEDLPVLIAHFLHQRGDGRTVSFAPDAIARLAAHAWPGNLRELRNLCERAAICHPGAVIGADAVARLLPVGATVPAATAVLGGAGIDLRAMLDRIEADYIDAALSRANGVVAEAARLLGLRRTTLIEKMRRLPQSVA